MTQRDTSTPPAILSVPRTKADARRFYDRISRFYGWMTGAFERKHGERALGILSIRDGGPSGNRHWLRTLLPAGGQTRGRQRQLLRRRHLQRYAEGNRGQLHRSGLAIRAGLYCADATNLPFRDNSFDTILMAFTLELFDTPEIPKVVQETMRVLKPGGRIAVVGLSKEGGASTAVRLYEWAHRKWPRYADCRRSTWKGP